MVSRLARSSPLTARQTAFAAVSAQSHASVTLVERPFVPQLNVRTRSGSSLDSVLGGPLPVAACSSARYGDVDVLWLGPDEWLILGLDQGAVPGTASTVAITDVSAQRTIIEVGGPSAGDVLSRGCAIDFDPAVTPMGSCVQTLIARTGVTIVVRDATATSFWLLVRSSFAEYLGAWLIDACSDL